MQECAICIKQMRHGGECHGKWSANPCLLFERDPRGELKLMDTFLIVPFGRDIPELNKEFTEVTLSGIDKTITVTKFKKIKWERDKKGALMGVIISMEIMYWTEENGVITKKPKLKLVK